jgi:hypothetical protein
MTSATEKRAKSGLPVQLKRVSKTAQATDGLKG